MELGLRILWWGRAFDLSSLPLRQKQRTAAKQRQKQHRVWKQAVFLYIPRRSQQDVEKQKQHQYGEKDTDQDYKNISFFHKNPPISRQNCQCRFLPA